MMDYEKAYKAVLKTATQWIKDGCTDKEKICLECVFPELRESEDERIRKWLVDYFGSIKEVVWIHRDITCEQILGWLEKQKEQKPSWKPSEEQIRSLEYFIELWGDSDGQLKYAKIFNDVKSLCEQLKSL